MQPSGQDPGLDRRPVAGRPQHAGGVHPLLQAFHQLPVAGADEADEPHVASQGAHVARGVAGSAGQNGGAIVLENENRRLARDAGGVPVQELVTDHVADDQDPSTGEPLGEADQPEPEVGFTPSRVRS